MDWKQEFATKAKMHADVVVGLGVIKFGYSGEKRGWWLPGGVHTTSYIEAESAAKAINRIMMGAP